MSKKQPTKAQRPSSSHSDIKSPEQRADDDMNNAPDDAPEELTDCPEALKGQMDADYPLTSNIVRIFTSSTFTDTKVERNALMERVYPVLKAHCQEQGYDFQVVDMRWGVRDEATDDHMTSELCMKEIKACQKFSTGPNFITFLAQKYGYRPFPPHIKAEEFELLLSGIQETDDKQLISDWFLLDENVVPPMYQLQPIRSKLPNYADDSDPDKKKEARNAWWSAFERMQLILRQASISALTDPDKIQKYHWSVTEEEITVGLLQSQDPNKQCYWFKRYIHDLMDNTKDKMARRFMDIAEGVDQEAYDFLQRLKNELIPEKLSLDNITDYEVPWTDNGIDPAKSKEHEEYLEKFLVDFERELKRKIDAGIEDRKQGAVVEPLSLECINHVTFAQSKAQIFQGRGKVMKDIKDTLVGEKKQNVPLVLFGEPGSGKTTLMAKLAEAVPQWLQEENAAVKPEAPDDSDNDEREVEPSATTAVIRFIGTTSKSSTTRELLSSFNEQIIRVMDRNDEPATDLKELKSQFLSLIDDSDARLLILLDSLDQLSDAGMGLKDWIPKTLPDTVTMVLSAIPGEQYSVGPELKVILPEESFIAVPAMEKDEITDIIQYSLKQSNRTLQQQQTEILERACQSCALPLYVKIAVDEARRWHSHTLVSPAHLGAVINDLIEDLFERVEKYHGKVLVSHALGYVTAAKAGLSGPEIEDVLSCDDVVLRDVLQYHVPPQRRLPPLLWIRIQSDLSEYLVVGGADGATQVYRWYHRQFQTVAAQRYLTEDEQRKYLHTSLAEYFMGKWSPGTCKLYVDHKTGKEAEADRFIAKQPYVFSDKGDKVIFNLRKISELPYQLIKSGDVELLKEKALCNFEFLYEKLRAVGFDIWYDDFEQAKKENVFDADLTLLMKTMLQCKDALSKGAYNLATQIFGRLGDKADTPKKDDNKAPNDQGKGKATGNKKDSTSPQKEDEQQEEIQDSIASLVEQARNPHTSCLVTRLAYLKQSGNALVAKFTGIGSSVYALAMNADCTLAATWNMESILQIWDIQSTAEKQSISVSTAELYISFVNTLMFMEGDTKMLAVTNNQVHLIDLSKEAIVASVDIPFSENPASSVSLHCLPSGTTLVVMNDMPEIRAFNFPGNGKMTVKVDGLEKEDSVAQRMARSYMGGDGEDIIFNRAGSNKLHFFSLKKYKETLTTVKLFPGEKEIKPTVRVCMSDTGLAGCHVYMAPGAQLDSSITAEVKIFDVKKKALLRTIKDIPGGFVLGMEHLVPMGGDNILMNSFLGQTTLYQQFNLKEGTYTPLLKLREGMTIRLVASPTMVVGVPMTEHDTLVHYDLTAGLDDGDEEGGTPEWFSEGYQFLGLLPGSSRFVGYSTLAGNFNIWDLATSRTVRGFRMGGNGSETQWLDDKRVVIPVKQGMVTVDMLQMKVINNLPGIFANSNDQPLRFGLLDKGIVFLVGPSDNQVSFVNLKNGKNECKLTLERGVKLGGVYVSEQKTVALVGVQQHVPGQPANVGPKDGIAKIYVIDLKTRKRLPDIVLKDQTSKLFVTAHGYNHAKLSKDGKFYASKVSGKPDAVWLWNTKTGLGAAIQEEDEHDSINLVNISDTLRCVVMVYLQHKIKLWNYDKKKFVKTIATTAEQITDVVVSDDGLHLGVVIATHEAVVISLETGQWLYQVSSPTTISRLKVPANGEFLLIAIASVKGLGEFFWHRPQQGTLMDDICQQLIKKEKDKFGEPKYEDLTSQFNK